MFAADLETAFDSLCHKAMSYNVIYFGRSFDILFNVQYFCTSFDSYLGRAIIWRLIEDIVILYDVSSCKILFQ